MWQWFLQLGWPLQGLLIVGALAVLWALLTLVFIPILAVLQRLLTPGENTTTTSQSQYLVGTLTLGVARGHTGEVMVTGGGGARQVYPARLWRLEDDALSQATRVVVIELRGGIAYVEAIKTDV